MKTYDKAIRAVQKSKLGFDHLIQTSGRCTYIINRDARNPLLGPATNDRNMKLMIDSKMSISEMTSQILEKWGNAERAA